MKQLMSYGPLFIVLASLLWSLDGLLRVSLYSLPPLVIVFLEHLVGFALLLPFVFKDKMHLKGLSLKTWGAFAWITVLSSVLGTVFYTAALGYVQFAQFSVVVLLQQLEPLVVLVFARLVLKEPLSRKYIPWFVVALIAAYFVSFPNLVVNLETGRGTAMAALLAIGAAFAWGSSTVFSRYTLLQLPSLLTTAVRFGLAAVLAGAMVLVFGHGAVVTQVTPSQWMTLLVIALSTGMVALSIYYYGLKRTPARIATICELAWPLSAVVLDYVYFHKALTVTQGLGALVLLLTIYKVSGMVKEDKKNTAAIQT
jgi:drug/metabolite transporter (DMT)-like permease